VGRVAKAGVRREGEEKRELWCLDKVDERGEWGRGWAGFVGSEAAVRQDVLGFAGGKGEGKVSLDKYMACESIFEVWTVGVER
jgi:H3 lysine-79-specific histone-lysine N-methyltransferase